MADSLNNSLNNTILLNLKEQFNKATAPPYLFVGSGFSQRYLNFPCWRELLDYFCKEMKKPINYYCALANNDYPMMSSLISDDYFKYCWNHPRKKLQLVQHDELKNKSDVLKFYISRYLKWRYNNFKKDNKYIDEIKKLEQLNVDAIITTNWDCYLDDLFPDYSKFIGQDEIITANPYGIGEIYKIHGCITDPSSLVLTKEDYAEFTRKYAYLAAKLITFLIEHPIIFIGYSLKDENIRIILEKLADCLGTTVYDRLKNNLYFVQRSGIDREEGIHQTFFKIDKNSIPLTTITTDNFGIVYEAINSTKRKIPARILRFVKSELYELVKSEKPENRICITDIEDIDNNDIEYVVGIGVKKLHEQELQREYSENGYQLVKIEDILLDVLDSESNLSIFTNINRLLEHTLPYYIKKSANTPIFKYLRMIGITNDTEYKSHAFNLDKAYNRKFSDFYYTTGTYQSKAIHSTISDIIKKNTPQRAALLIAHLEPAKIDTETLRSFLIMHKDWSIYNNSQFSSFRKLLTIYDRLKFGWID